MRQRLERTNVRDSGTDFGAVVEGLPDREADDERSEERGADEERREQWMPLAGGGAATAAGLLERHGV